MNDRDAYSQADRKANGAIRWVKVAGLVLAVVVLLAVAMMLIGGAGGHGPARHGGTGRIGITIESSGTTTSTLGGTFG